VFNTSLLALVGLLAVLSAVAYWRGGLPLLGEGLSGGLGLLVRFALLVAVAFLVAGMAERVIPHEWVRDALGEEAGVRGIAIATVAGMVTPSGPFVSMPIAAALLRSGAGVAAIVAYLTAWSTLGVYRFFTWEVPILGLPFALLRFGACLALPFVAALVVRLLRSSS